MAETANTAKTRTASPASTTPTANRRSGARTAATKRRTAATKRRTAATKRSTAATKRSTAAKKASATRARRATVTPTVPSTPVEQAQELAERAVLIPIGATLEARDALRERVAGLVDTYSTRTSVEKQLRRFERRGSKEIRRVERDVRKARTRAERELRRRRTRVERALRQNRTRVERETRGLRRDIGARGDVVRKNVGANVELAAAQVGNAMQSGVTAGTRLVSDASDRVANVA